MAECEKDEWFGFLVTTYTRVDDATMRENIQRAIRIE